MFSIAVTALTTEVRGRAVSEPLPCCPEARVLRRDLQRGQETLKLKLSKAARAGHRTVMPTPILFVEALTLAGGCVAGLRVGFEDTTAPPFREGEERWLC